MSTRKTRPAPLRCEPLEDRLTPADLAPSPSIAPPLEREILVTTAADVVSATDGLTSLREAIADANTDPAGTVPVYYGTPVIRFAPALAGAAVAVSQVGGTTHGAAAFEIRRYVRIDGSGQKISRAATAPNMRLFTVLGSTPCGAFGGLTVEGVELLGGYSDGFGGAIYSAGGSVSITDSLLAGHSASGFGGAIYSAGGSVNLTNSTIADSRARPTAAGTSAGGAVYLVPDTPDTGSGFLSVNYSTLAGNVAGRGAQVFTSGVAVSVNRSVLHTSAAATGGAADLEVINNTIVRGAVVTPPDRNLIGRVVGYDGVNVGTDPLLGPLQDNGGPTRTMLPQPGSPAVDAGDGVLTGYPTRDQRGFVRGVGRKSDLGAAEAGADATGAGYVPPSLVVGAAAGQPPVVRVLRGDGSEVTRFLAYDAGFLGGVRVAMADVTGDGAADVITATGPGGAPHVKVFDGVTFAEVRSFFAFDVGFRGGVSLAVGDVTNDGVADVITGAGAGGAPHVKAFDGTTGAEAKSFFAFAPGFTGGVSVATGDYQTGLVVAAGPGGAPHVKVYDTWTMTEGLSFLAYDPAFRGGVTVTYVNGHVITGTATGAPHVKAFRDTRYYGLPAGRVPVEVASLFAGDPASTAGVTVGTASAPVWPPPDFPYYFGVGADNPAVYTSVGADDLARYTLAYDDDYTDPTNPIYRTRLEPQPLDTVVPGPVGSVGGLPWRPFAIPASAGG